MAEAAKKEAPRQVSPGCRRVLAIHTGEGGVELPELGPRSQLREAQPDNALSQTPHFHMELDRSLGGVVIRYTSRATPYTVLVPLAHLRAVWLAD